jgi:hypothetical protein
MIVPVTLILWFWILTASLKATLMTLRQRYVQICSNDCLTLYFMNPYTAGKLWCKKIIKVYQINDSVFKMGRLHCTFFQIRKRARDRDPFRMWQRFSWPVHRASCIHLGTFESFYHMSPDDFEAMFELLDIQTDPRAGESSFFKVSVVLIR